MLMQLYTLSKELQSGSKLRIVEQEISHKQYQNQQRKAELREQAYEIELLKRNLFVLVIIFISLIVLSIFLYQWYKRKKNMQLMVTRYNLEQSEHELAELKVRQQELELKSVQSALYNSRQEATSFAVFLHSRNELLEKIREMIKQGYKMDQQALIPHLKKVNAFISQYQNGDKTNSTLLMNVEEKEPGVPSTAIRTASQFNTRRKISSHFITGKSIYQRNLNAHRKCSQNNQHESISFT